MPSSPKRLNRKGKLLTSNGSLYLTAKGQRYQQYLAQVSDCQACLLRKQCLKSPTGQRGREVVRLVAKAMDNHSAPALMRQAIDSRQDRDLYSQRLGTVEPVFANLQHNKKLTRFNLRGRIKVDT